MNEVKLSELDPDFYQNPDDDSPGPHGLFFNCPICTRGGIPHSINVPFVPPSPYPSGALWQVLDANMETLTLSPSIDCTSSGTCTFHGWVKQGVVTW